MSPKREDSHHARAERKLVLAHREAVWFNDCLPLELGIVSSE